jgi:hypothetical protein
VVVATVGDGAGVLDPAGSGEGLRVADGDRSVEAVGVRLGEGEGEGEGEGLCDAVRVGVAEGSSVTVVRTSLRGTTTVPGSGRTRK